MTGSTSPQDSRSRSLSREPTQLFVKNESTGAVQSFLFPTFVAANWAETHANKNQEPQRATKSFSDRLIVNFKPSAQISLI